MNSAICHDDRVRLLVGSCRRQRVSQVSAASRCCKRIKDLEAGGVIRGCTVVVDPEKVGWALRVVVEAHMALHSEQPMWQFEKAVAASPASRLCNRASCSSRSSRGRGCHRVNMGRWSGPVVRAKRKGA